MCLCVCVSCLLSLVSMSLCLCVSRSLAEVSRDIGERTGAPPLLSPGQHSLPAAWDRRRHRLLLQRSRRGTYLCEVSVAGRDEVKSGKFSSYGRSAPRAAPCVKVALVSDALHHTSIYSSVEGEWPDDATRNVTREGGAREGWGGRTESRGVTSSYL